MSLEIITPVSPILDKSAKPVRGENYLLLLLLLHQDAQFLSLCRSQNFWPLTYNIMFSPFTLCSMLHISLSLSFSTLWNPLLMKDHWWWLKAETDKKVVRGWEAERRRDPGPCLPSDMKFKWKTRQKRLVSEWRLTDLQFTLWRWHLKLDQQHHYHHHHGRRHHQMLQ